MYLHHLHSTTLLRCDALRIFSESVVSPKKKKNNQQERKWCTTELGAERESERERAMQSRTGSIDRVSDT